MRTLKKIVSGGQTGADRAALDFAMRHGIDHGGWCPQGRRAEDGPVDERYRLQETPARHYAVRTRWNVRDSDGTLVVTTNGSPTGGTALTLEYAASLGRPCLHVHPAAADPEQPTAVAVQLADALQKFLAKHQIATLNVAGPRASHQPEVGRLVDELLTAWLEQQENV